MKELKMSSLQEKLAESSADMGKSVGVFIQKTISGGHPELVLADSVGRGPYGPHQTESYGFLVEDRSRRSWGVTLFGLADPIPRDRIAVLWLSSEARKATHKKWVLEIFGREYVDFFKALADKLSKQFDIEIHVRLTSEHPMSEQV
ncbi:hypothetical protein EXS57_01380 [Candidatus Kaiserbacteria bacterium]|nr:hypothetical protein [Candidatus Kaiserbacteria bacterium]